MAFHGFFQGVNLGGTSWKGASLGSFLLRLVGARSPPKNQGLNNKGSQVLISPEIKLPYFFGGGTCNGKIWCEVLFADGVLTYGHSNP